MMQMSELDVVLASLKEGKTREYERGQEDYREGVLLRNAGRQYGTSTDQMRWLAGWLDAMAEDLRESSKHRGERLGNELGITDTNDGGDKDA